MPEDAIGHSLLMKPVMLVMLVMPVTLVMPVVLVMPVMLVVLVALVVLVMPVMPVMPVMLVTMLLVAGTMLLMVMMARGIGTTRMVVQRTSWYVDLSLTAFVWELIAKPARMVVMVPIQRKMTATKTMRMIVMMRMLRAATKVSPKY